MQARLDRVASCYYERGDRYERPTGQQPGPGLDRSLESARPGRHCATDVEFTSPFVPALSGEPSGTIHGREPLKEYFRKGLQAYPGLHFELLHTLTEVDSLLLYYRSVKELLAAEMMMVNEEGQIQTVHAHYAQK